MMYGVGPPGIDSDASPAMIDVPLEYNYLGSTTDSKDGVETPITVPGMLPPLEHMRNLRSRLKG